MDQTKREAQTKSSFIQRTNALGKWTKRNKNHQIILFERCWKVIRWIYQLVATGRLSIFFHFFGNFFKTLVCENQLVKKIERSIKSLCGHKTRRKITTFTISHLPTVSVKEIFGPFFCTNPTYPFYALILPYSTLELIPHCVARVHIMRLMQFRILTISRTLYSLKMEENFVWQEISFIDKLSLAIVKPWFDAKLYRKWSCVIWTRIHRRDYWRYIANSPRNSHQVMQISYRIKGNKQTKNEQKLVKITIILED